MFTAGTTTIVGGVNFVPTISEDATFAPDGVLYATDYGGTL